MAGKTGLVGLALLILILDGKTAIFGAGAGIRLCLEAVIPALFPFFVLTGLLPGRVSALRPLARVLGIPAGAEGLLIPAFLGGYPMGAGCIGTACRQGRMDRQTGERLLAFCSNAGPAFLFGVAGPLFPEAWMAWSLWGIHVLSAVLTAAVLPCRDFTGELAPGKPGNPAAVMKNAVAAMGAVCGWIVFARVVLAFLDRWVLWLFPQPVQVLISGMVELTNGCLRLGYLESLSGRYVLCSVFLSLGGLCVALQTSSVAEGLRLRWYFRGKGLQTLFSFVLALGVVTGFWPALMAFSGLFLLISVRIRKNSRKIAAAGV